MAYGLQSPKNLADVLTQMSYGDLLDVARQFVEMNSDGERDIKTKYGMADTLFDWAESVVEEAEIDAKAYAEAQAKAKAQQTKAA